MRNIRCPDFIGVWFIFCSFVFTFFITMTANAQTVMSPSAAVTTSIDLSSVAKAALSLLAIVLSGSGTWISLIVTRWIKNKQAQQLIEQVAQGAGALGANALGQIHISNAKVDVKNGALAVAAKYLITGAGDTLKSLGYDPSTPAGDDHIRALAEKAITNYQNGNPWLTNTGLSADAVVQAAAPSVAEAVDAVLEHVPAAKQAVAVLSAIQSGASVSSTAMAVLKAAISTSAQPSSEPAAVAPAPVSTAVG